MSWNNFILQVADDKANALVFGTSLRFAAPAQTADIKYGKGLRALHNALDKAMPAAIERAKVRKNAIYIAHLEKQGYTVLFPSEVKELETEGV